MKHSSRPPFEPDYKSGCTALCSVLVWVVSFLLSYSIKTLFPTFDGLPMLLILMAAFALACMGNRIAAKVFARNHFGMHPDEHRALLDQHAEEMKADPAAALAKFRGIETLPMFLLVVYFLLTVAIGALAVPCIVEDASLGRVLLCCLAAMLPLALSAMAFYNIFSGVFNKKLNKAALVPKGKLPMTEAMAQKAANAVGVKGKIRLELTRDCDYDVHKFGKTYVVFLGSRLLSVLTEEETYQCLLMSFEAFAHEKEYLRILRVHRLGELCGATIRLAFCVFDLFFSYAGVTIAWEYDFYYMAFRNYLDRCGYERVKEVGDPRAAVNALCKRGMWRYYVFEANHYLTTPFFYEPEPHKHMERDVCNAFRRALWERHKVWLDMQAREMRPAGNYNSLFRDIRQYLDPDGGETLQDSEILDLETPYGEEVAKAIKQYLELRVYQDIAPTYKAARKREYLEPLAVTETYEQDPTGYTTPELSPVINAYRDICRYDKAEAICDTILETETNPFAQAHALYFKGMCMLNRYETEGIDLIYRAIDLNKNYMKEGFEMVEEYCTLCGLADEYEYFLRRAINQMSAHSYNHEAAGELTPRDHLVKETELGDMLTDILAYMEKVSEGCIREIYLVRKVISEDFFSSVFVLHFEYGADREAMDRVYVAIFNYLDAYPVDWQFSLFLYNRETEAAVRQVEGSLVWKKNA